VTGQDHYFSARPATPDQRQEVAVELMGRRVVVETAPGIFSPGGLDKGTAVLLGEVPNPPPGGDFLDIGCGWGPIAISMAMLSPEPMSMPSTSTNDRSTSRGAMQNAWVAPGFAHHSPRKWTRTCAST
jgi:16S rRNA (guanine1207-N2)-methyltransferase